MYQVPYTVYTVETISPHIINQLTAIEVPKKKMYFQIPSEGSKNQLRHTKKDEKKKLGSQLR